MPGVIPGPVLEGVGVGKPLDFSGWREAADLAMRQKEMRQRQAFQADQAQARHDAANTDFNEKQLASESSHDLTGDDFDPNIKGFLDNAKTTAFKMAQNHADQADIQLAIAPDLQKAAQYRARVKFINGNIAASVAKHKNDPGFDADAATRAAQEEAWYTKDEKGNRVLNDPMKVDPAKDYVGQAMVNNPDVTNFGGLDAYTASQMKDPNEFERKVTTATPTGSTQTSGYKVTAPGYMNFERDDNGNPNPNAPMVPKFQNMTDDNGKPIGRMVTDEVYNNIVNSRNGKSIEMSVYHEANKWFKAHGQDVSPTSDKFKMMEKSILYDELASRTHTKVHSIESEHVSGADAEIDKLKNPEYRKLKINEAYAESKAHAEGAAAGKGADGELTPKQKVANRIPNIVNAINGNNANAVTVNVKLDPTDDRSPEVPMIDLKSATDDGKFAHGGGQFAELFYNPDDKNIYFKKVQGAQQFQKVPLKQFLKQNATSNGLNSAKVDELLPEKKKSWLDLGKEDLESGGLPNFNLPGTKRQ